MNIRIYKIYESNYIKLFKTPLVITKLKSPRIYLFFKNSKKKENISEKKYNINK